MPRPVVWYIAALSAFTVPAVLAVLVGGYLGLALVWLGVGGVCGLIVWKRRHVHGPFQTAA